jgi:lysophospholipase L1-like esterase
MSLASITIPDYGPFLYVGDGDSLTLGISAGANRDYVTQLLFSMTNQWMIRNFGVSGQFTGGMIINAPGNIDPLLADGHTKHILGAWGGTNDLALGGLTAAQVYASFVTYCQTRKTAGWKVVAFTLLPRSDAGIPGSFETDRQTVNTNIRANWATFADALCDTGLNANIGAPGASTNATYFVADQVHLTGIGYGVVAVLAKTAALSIP